MSVRVEDQGRGTTPRVFISYAWEDEDYRGWVQRLATALRRDGVDARLDEWDQEPGQDFVAFMNTQASRADRILVIGSPGYRAKVEAHEAGEAPAGVGWEAGLLAAHVFGGERQKLVFAIGRGERSEALPLAYRNQLSYSLAGPDGAAQYDRLLEDLLGRRTRAPEVGSPPPVARTVPEPLFRRPGGASASGPEDESGSASRAIDQRNTSRVVRDERFQAFAGSENRGNLLKYRLQDRGEELGYSDVLDLWENDPAFVDFYLSVLKGCGFYSFVWETPPISSSTVERAFEFVLHNSPAASASPDRTTYAQYFDTESAKHGIVAFDNLGGDALLVVPSPIRADANYSGLAEFFREAPLFQQRALWRELAHHARTRLSAHPMWISVAGGGIGWLHIRLDSAPKYYRYAPYTVEAR